MKLTILGATGKTGLHVVRQALERGYDVTVLVRTPGKLGEYREQVHILEGDATHPHDVCTAITGANAVLSTLGYGQGTPPGMFTSAAQNIISAMRQCRIRRLVWLTGVGIPAKEDTPKILDKLLNAIMRVFASSMIFDATTAANAIQESGLDWTIVRVPLLTSSPGTGKYQVGMVGYSGMSLRIPREDVARFILDALGAKRFYGKLPVVSSGSVNVRK
ncbi:MAG: SDR family oxidoreductase [Patescibacteria group bacterium]|nr:SDR family oxidoreductase [Patescibacteria group bacterium]